MPLSRIQHYLIAADDPDATRDWYRDVLGMTEGPHPDFGFPVHWMYVEGDDVVHIGPNAANAGAIQKQYLGRTSANAGAGTGAVDHIAFRATDLPAMMERLEHHQVPFTQRRANAQALYQLFLTDPNGIKVELNFDAAETAGVRPELMASDLIGKP